MDGEKSLIRTVPTIHAFKPGVPLRRSPYLIAR